MHGFSRAGVPSRGGVSWTVTRLPSIQTSQSLRQRGQRNYARCITMISEAPTRRSDGTSFPLQPQATYGHKAG